MAAMSRGPAAKARAPKKRKGGTESSRNHSFKGFSHRIANLKIEPVRRGRSTILDDAELENTFSYFKDSLEEWKARRLATDFVNFARLVTPLCDSLPQVLHHSDRILDLLVEHIEKGDKNAEEPLLSLMAHLAHDLGASFEKHFERAVKTVSRLAAKHPEVEVIEWSFNCLAWLFKYLSRLLVPDLRPVFDLMAPLLGREHQKHFVTRFAAESLSFLVRKAGAVHHKNKAPLKLIIRHISEQLEALQGSGKDFEFQQGLMSLFADSMKGVQRGLHSSAAAILQELLLQSYDEEYINLRIPPLEPILLGVITSTIHHSDAENFHPLLKIILTEVKTKAAAWRTEFLGLSSRLLFVTCGVRKGSRISDWRHVFETLSVILNTANESTKLDTRVARELQSAIAIIFHYSPLDAAIPCVQLLEILFRESWEELCLPFCNFFADLGAERFKSLLLPYFRRFITQKAHEHGPELCLILPGLYQNGILSEGSLQPSKRWQDCMVQSFLELTQRQSSTSDLARTTYECNALIDAIDVLSISPEIKQAITKYIYTTFEQAVEIDSSEYPQPMDLFAAGNGFRFLVHDPDFQNSLHMRLPTLGEASSVYGQSLQFWRALLSLLEKNKSNLEYDVLMVDPFKRTLMRCLACPSHNIRLAALSILEIVGAKSEELRTIIATALMIEETPLNLENQRALTMRIGQLAKMYPTVCSDELVGEAIPTFCFGLLHVQLTSAWDDACSALKAMCETKEGEAHVSKIAFEWLSDSGGQEFFINVTTPGASTASRYATEFECTNIMQLEETVAKDLTGSEVVDERLKANFEMQHARVPFVTSINRTQALRILNALPHVAEKRSRLLVPVLLDWALDQGSSESLEGDAPLEEAEVRLSCRWTRKDQKAMLSVFSKFVNPKVLFRSNEVYQALLALLSNGDVEIQKGALKALLTWKEAAVAKYQEELFNLLDDARLRDEISVFLGQGQILVDHLGQLLPIILRLLYGRVISGKEGLASKRKAVFSAVACFGEEAVRQFLSIALGPLSGISVIQDGLLNEDIISKELLNPRKQHGMLNMLEDMLSTLKTTFTPFTGTAVDPLLYCLIQTSRNLSRVSGLSKDDSAVEQTSQVSLLRIIRQRALHCLTMLFENSPGYDWYIYVPSIVTELVLPRLQRFPIETAQSVSGLLRLFAAWSKSTLTAPHLVAHHSDILSKIIDTLEVPSAKDDVKQFVLDNIIRRLIALVNDGDDESIDAKMRQSRIHSEILQPYAHAILQRVGDLLKGSPTKDVLESGVQAIAELAPHVVGSADSRRMIEIATFLLRQPSKRVNVPTKLGLLRILHEFIPRCDSKDLGKLFNAIFDSICPLFSFFNDRISRGVLCSILEDLSSYEEELSIIAPLCHDLNSFSTSRLDEPDYDRRDKAFIAINEGQHKSYSIKQWKPLVYNMLYYIKDNDELSIRRNASLCLRQFIEVSKQDEKFKVFISSAILPGIQNGIRETSELVRVEFLDVLARLVKVHDDWPPVADLYVLLTEDEESSFFSNILHIQGQRRLRALRRLASSAPKLQPGNVYHILIPLLEHFIFNKAADESANNLAGEAIKSISILTEWVEWPQFRSLLKRFVGYLSSKEDMQKTIVKLLAGLMDSLNQAGRTKGYITSGSDEHIESPHNQNMEELELVKPVSTLAKTLPQQEKLISDLTNNVLPDLTKFLHNKDEATVSVRVPIAIAVTKILLVLPPQEIETRLPPVLLDISHILKSRAPESRDMARNTLSEIAALTGPSYLGFILKALRTALQRGYQLHVLSFTLHHILVNMAEQLKPGDLDYCVAEIVDVIMDDTFGITGQEKDADEYTSKMKEVKSSKSFDSMDIIARSTTPSHLVELVLPIQSLLLEKLHSKMVQKIDELLRRIGLGVLQNPTVQNRDILIFCYELIQKVYKASTSSDQAPQEDPRNKRYLVAMKGAAKSGARYSSSSYMYKITRFSLDILRIVFKKQEDLRTPQNLAGFLPIIGDAMVQGEEEVQISAIRLLTTIVKVPMVELDRDCPVYITEAVRVIKGAPSSNTEIAQASLKLVSAVLRERPNVEIKERDLAHLLKRILPDLDEPDRQGVTFGFLKAVMDRDIVITEVYEVMDKVTEMMVTNQTESTRDVARSNFFRFLKEYPKKTSRFQKQVEFLLRNLQFDYVEGRQSVMEALNLVITKLETVKLVLRAEDNLDDIFQNMLGTIFLPLVNTMANDDSPECRELASGLLKQLFKKVVERNYSQRLKAITNDLREWLEQDENTGFKRLGIQCWGLYLEVADAKPKELTFVLDQLQSTVQKCLERCNEDDWELVYYSLAVFVKACKLFPDSTLSSDKQDFWTAIQFCVSYPHAWVKLTAAKLIGTYFADLASTNGDSGLGRLPLEGSRDLQLKEESMIQLTNAFLKNLLTPNVTEELCNQSVRNLAFLARCLAANGAKWNFAKVDGDDEEEDVAIETGRDATNGLVDASDDEFRGFSPPLKAFTEEKGHGISPTAIHRLMIRLSGIIRRETKMMMLPALYPKTATMTLLETLSAKLPVDCISSSLPHLLTTLSTVTDPATTIPRSTDMRFNESYKVLIDKAREVMNVLQKRMGTQEYLKVMGEVQKGVKQRRDDRRQKRKVEAITHPEKVGREKRRRHDVARMKRKERSAENRGRRRGW